MLKELSIGVFTFGPAAQNDRTPNVEYWTPNDEGIDKTSKFYILHSHSRVPRSGKKNAQRDLSDQHWA